MMASRSLKLAVLGLLGIPALIFGIQNGASSVAVVFLGQPLVALPVSLSLLAAYGLGGGMGMLLLGGWRFHDRVILRKSQKSLDLLYGRLMELERSRYRPNYSLPDHVQGSPIGSNSAVSDASTYTDPQPDGKDPYRNEPYRQELDYPNSTSDPRDRPNWQWYDRAGEDPDGPLDDRPQAYDFQNPEDDPV